jgi:hypothetical protein
LATVLAPRLTRNGAASATVLDLAALGVPADVEAGLDEDRLVATLTGMAAARG